MASSFGVCFSSFRDSSCGGGGGGGSDGGGGLDTPHMLHHMQQQQQAALLHHGGGGEDTAEFNGIEGIFQGTNFSCDILSPCSSRQRSFNSSSHSLSTLEAPRVAGTLHLLNIYRCVEVGHCGPSFVGGLDKLVRATCLFLL